MDKNGGFSELNILKVNFAAWRVAHVQAHFHKLHSDSGRHLPVDKLIQTNNKHTTTIQIVEVDRVVFLIVLKIEFRNVIISYSLCVNPFGFFIQIIRSDHSAGRSKYVGITPRSIDRFSNTLHWLLFETAWYKPDMI